MIKNQLKPLPNIKEKDIKVFSNQQMLAGTPPGASDPSAAPKLTKVAVHSMDKTETRQGEVSQNPRETNQTPPKHQNNNNQAVSNQKNPAGTLPEGFEPVWENLRLWQIFKNFCSRLLNICPNFAFKCNFEASMILKHSQEISQNEPACSEDSKNGAGNVNPTSIGRVRPERRRQIRPA